MQSEVTPQQPGTVLKETLKMFAGKSTKIIKYFRCLLAAFICSINLFHWPLNVLNKIDYQMRVNSLALTPFSCHVIARSVPGLNCSKAP